jgi:hypothetical protein
MTPTTLSQEKTQQPRLSGTQHSADDDDDELVANGYTRAAPTDHVQVRQSLTIENLRERTTAEIRRPSEDMSASKDELPQASHGRAAETEHIEIQQGPNGERIMLRRGINPVKEVLKSPTLTQTLQGEWPSYDDDD